MCGFAGIRTLGEGSLHPEPLDRMAELLHHRGPDESATWIGGRIGLAHTRLAIIDLAASHQPMHSADGRWVVAFNGEIFNHDELRRLLDYPFRTHGDTEVLVAGLALHGIDFVERLRGQFAFAAHDLRDNTTHLVRDRLGVLPLYHRRVPEGIVFGSEVKALLAVGPPPSVDLASLDAYLGSRAVPSPHTLFEGVAKLPPAHRAVVDAQGRMDLVRYWEPPVADPESRWTPARAVDAVEDGVRDAVRAALVADVPLGSYLSGGVDSSLIVAMLTELRGDAPVQTFSAGFGDPRHDELPWARRVSDLLGTQHHEVQVREADFEEQWSRLTWHRDAPVSEPADIAVHALARSAREHVGVVLSGEGGDELFAGYPKYRYARAAERLTRLPGSVRAGVIGPLERRLPAGQSRIRTALRAVAAADAAAQLETWFAPFTAPERAALLGGVAAQQPRRLPEAGGVDPVDRMLRHDLRAWLPDNLLERGDRMSMAASLELRPPLLDHHLVELAFRLPSSVKVRGGTTKWVLKEVARRHLPAEVVDRRKVGFRVPLDRWFRAGLRDTARDRLTGTDSWVAQTLDRRAVRDLLERHERGQSNEEARLWTLLCLEVWHSTFFTGLGAPPVPRPRAAETVEVRPGIRA